MDNLSLAGPLYCLPQPLHPAQIPNRCKTGRSSTIRNSPTKMDMISGSRPQLLST